MSQIELFKPKNYMVYTIKQLEKTKNRRASCGIIAKTAYKSPRRAQKGSKGVKWIQLSLGI
ncbi:MAG: hypothetical protein [Microvirus sp.]|nr:MAG: hypothetical protein [Microvirus sp.]